MPDAAPSEEDLLARDVRAAADDVERRAPISARPRQSGVRAVLARLPMFDLGSPVPERVVPLVNALKAFSPKVDLKEVLRAYEIAEAAHAGQRRRSGEPYIVHPIGVAEVLAELGMDTPTIVAALLHDTVEDTHLSVDDVAREFGDTAALLVDGVTKLDRIKTSSKEEQQAESLRKMLIAMASDLRVLLIKLADRLHNMKTIHHLPRAKQERIAEENCYAALGTLHAMWRPIPGRFKDYIAMPKFNLYQSLHTTVVGPEGKAIEVQIRTRAMHRTAEFGIAAHWKYKQAVRADQSETQWLSSMLTMQSDTQDSGEFLRNVRLDLYADEVFVFTPKGDVTALPRGSTPVDFAYAVHTEVGHRCVGARINGRLVALEYELRNGETVEILTSKASDAGPSRDWLDFVGSSRARSKIRQWFSRERREDAIEKGRDELQRALGKLGLGWKRLMTSAELKAQAKRLGHPDLDGLYRAIGDGHVSAASVAQQLAGAVADEEEAEEVLQPTQIAPRARSSDAVLVEETEDVLVTLARCCTPVPRDEIIGFVTRGRGVSVHRADCPNAADLRRDPERMLAVKWNTSTPSSFRVTVQVEALDRKHLLRDITTVLGDLHVSILSAQVTTQRDRAAYLKFTFELADIAHLDHILGQMRRVDSVYDAYRVVPRGNGNGNGHGNGNGSR